MKKKLIIALMGLSKGGKTSFINSLSHNPKEMLAVHAKNEARTKVTVNYEYVPYGIITEAAVKNIGWNKARVACGGDYKNLDAYNKAVAEDEIYRAVGFQYIIGCENMFGELTKQIIQIEESITVKKMIFLINMERIDEYITTITIQIPANEFLSKLLMKKDMTLVLRDTRGLLDLMIEDGKNNTKNIYMKPLAELGLDGINGIIFMSEGTFQDSIAKIYSRMLRTVMNAVPIFLVYRDRTICEEFVDDVQCVLDVINNKKKNLDMFEDRFYEALNFLMNIGIVKDVSGEFEFATFNYFNKLDVEYLFPECTYLSKIKRGRPTKENPLEDESFVNYTYYTTYIMCDIIDKLLRYYDDIFNVFRGNTLSNVLRKHRYEFQEDVERDFKKYGNVYHTEYARPQVDYENAVSISNKMCDDNVDILGPRNGITSMNGRKMRYVASGVSGVTIERALRKWINKQTFYNEIDLESALDDDKKANVIKKALSYVLQKRFVDYYATIQGYNCMNRYIIQDNIVAIREKNVCESKAMYEFAGFVLDAFCKELEKVGNEAVWELIVDCGKNADIKY